LESQKSIENHARSKLRAIVKGGENPSSPARLNISGRRKKKAGSTRRGKGEGETFEEHFVARRRRESPIAKDRSSAGA